jgi:hypothetical protein
MSNKMEKEFRHCTKKRKSLLVFDNLQANHDNLSQPYFL